MATVRRDSDDAQFYPMDSEGMRVWKLQIYYQVLCEYDEFTADAGRLLELLRPTIEEHNQVSTSVLHPRDVWNAPSEDALSAHVRSRTSGLSDNERDMLQDTA